MQGNLLHNSQSEEAIDRIRYFATEPPVFVAFSGGKDSAVVLDLAHRSGIIFIPFQNVTGLDDPAVVRFIRQDARIKMFSPPKSLTDLAVSYGCLPTHKYRWCCRELKERMPSCGLVLTGIRAQESTRRAGRRMVETCRRYPRKHYLHPIIDWTTADVWTYVHDRDLPVAPLYKTPSDRIGCVLCPLTRLLPEDLQRYPHIANKWLRAAEAAYATSPRLQAAFPHLADYWHWWLDRYAPWPKPNDPFPDEHELPNLCPQGIEL